MRRSRAGPQNCVRGSGGGGAGISKTALSAGGSDNNAAVSMCLSLLFALLDSRIRSLTDLSCTTPWLSVDALLDLRVEGALEDGLVSNARFRYFLGM